jgi:hypothetical protein
MHTWFIEQTLSNRGNPLESMVVSRLMIGIKKVFAQKEVQEKRDRVVTQSLTPSLLRALRPYLLPLESTSDQRMQWAAMSLAVAGLLRPSEFVGSFNLDRSLRFDQCAFKGAPPGASGELATSLELDLGITKADPYGANPPHVIRDREAIVALWNWIEERSAMRDESTTIFACPMREDGPPIKLSIARLNRSLESAAIRGGYGPMKFTGRCFRRGGASGLMLQGASPQTIAARGRWKTQGMVEVYADAQAKNVRDSRLHSSPSR